MLRLRIMAGATVLATVAAAGWGMTPAAADTSLTGMFASASQEFGVPEPLLMAYSYSLTGWVDHDGQPSAEGGYGLMHLTSAAAVSPAGRGSDAPGRDAKLNADPAQNTLATAAGLLGEPADRLRTSEADNIRGGAAVLAAEARELGAGPKTLNDWYPVVEKLSGTSLANDVFTTLRTGAGSDGVRALLAPQRDVTVPPTATRGSAGYGSALPECPAELGCKYVPAAYETNNIADANAYGNYDPANRPADGMKIKYIVIHDMEGTYDGTISWFQNPAAYTSAHYVIRSSDGEVTQMVPTKDIAWHAANSLINDESIGIEHEGYATQGATWYTDAMYRNSATLVRYLAAKYHIPLDRQHIIGHDDVANQRNYPGSHWDPGAYWDWDRYMKLLHAPVKPVVGPLVTVAPGFAANQLTLTDCTVSPCTTLPTQSSSAVLLRSAPSDDAPLVTDPVIGGGTTSIDDWSDKAETGRTYAVAERRGGWTALWWGGQEAWVRSDVLRPAAGLTVRPKDGVQAQVFPANLPDPSEWPAGTPAGNPTTPAAPTPLYTITGNQRYLLADASQAEVYYARYDGNDVPYNHTIIKGAQTYLRISFNHRFMYVRASDVTIG